MQIKTSEPYKNRPIKFLEWAERKGYSIPLKLKTAAGKFHGPIPNYKELYHQAQEEVQSLKKELENSHVKQQIKDIGENPPSARPKNTYLKVILGMAIKKYDYDPNATQRNTTTGRNKGSIYADIEEIGLSVDDVTIRNILKEASELLPDKIT